MGEEVSAKDSVSVSGADIDTSNWTLVGLVQRQAAAYGDKEFMSFEHGTTLTFASFERDSDRLACNLASLGVAQGDRVMAVLKNRIEFMLAMIAVMKLGAIFVPINTELKGSFLQHQMRNSEPRALFLDHDLRDAFDNVTGGNDNLTATIYVAGEVPDALPEVLIGADAMTFEAFSARDGADAGVLVTPRPEDIACIMYTSGTTGPAKGVTMPHAHCYAFGYNMAWAMELTEADCQYICMPIFHGMGLLMQVVGSLIAGTKVYCVERFSPNRWLDEVRACGATVSNALGVMPEMIFRTPETAHDKDNDLRVVIAVPIAAPIVPNAGIGPNPRIRTIFKTMFMTVMATPKRSGVRASPAARRAPLIMKKINIPMLKTNMMRRYGSASTWTSGAALINSSRNGDRK